MSLALFKSTMKKNALLFTIFLAICTLYSAVMISMYSPASIEALNAMFQVMPENIMKALGFAEVFTDFLGYMGSWLYGLILTMFPLIFIIILCNRLVAKTVDSGSVACLLSTPNSRSEIIVTKAVFAAGSLLLLHALLFLINNIFAWVMFPEETIDMGLFLKMNISVYLVNLTAMSICFFFSCLFNNAGKALGFGAGVTIGLLVCNMLGSATPDTGILSDISIYGWYNPVGIAAGDKVLAVNLIYLGISLVLFLAGTEIFKRKQLPV